MYRETEADAFAAGETVVCLFEGIVQYVDKILACGFGYCCGSPPRVASS